MSQIAPDGWKAGGKVAGKSTFYFPAVMRLIQKFSSMLQQVSIACFAVWPDIRIDISQDILQGPPMPFVNERIPAEDFEKYQLREIDKRHVVGGVNARTWAVDR